MKTLTQSSIKDVAKDYPQYVPDEITSLVISNTFSKFRDAQTDRDRAFNYFDGQTLVEMINDSVNRYVTNINEREDLEDWQARINDPFTRNKVTAILGKIVRVLPIAEMTARGDEDPRKAAILSALYEYSEELDDYEELLTFILLEAIVKGTAIGYEGVDISNKKVRDVKNANDDILVSETVIKTTRPLGAIVPLEDFYPAAVSYRNIKSMPFCFWRSVIPNSKFLSDFSMHENAKYVQPKQTFTGEVERPFYADYISEDVQEGSVEVIRYYNKLDDEFVIIANGVWLNPIGNKVICPIPFSHKELPFWDIKFDFFGSDFFYGKSLPDKLKSMQDVLNVLTNMLLDQSFLTIFPPVLTSGMDSIEDDYLRPGRRTPIDTQGQPISNSIMKFDLGTPSGWHQYILEYTRKIMEQSSVDQVSSGQAGVGERTTAQEIRVAADAVAATIGLFGRLVNFGVKRKAKLRAANILQYWTDPQTPYIKKILGESGEEDVKKAFNIFKVDNTVLSSGKRGTKIIEIYSNKESLPAKDQLKARAQISGANSNKKVEITAFPAEYIRDFVADIKLVPNPKTEVSKELEKALQLEKVRVYMSFFPQQININELAAQTAEKMGDDPSKVLNQDVMNPQPVDPNNPEAASPMSTTPNDPAAQNAVRGAMGGQQGDMAMRDLANSMLG